MIKLEEISFCGINFGNSRWHSHSRKCDICKNKIEELKLIEKKLKDNWVVKCECGCGKITKYGNNFIVGHSQNGVKQTKTHKENRLNSWVKNGNIETYSKKWKNSNPSSSEENKKRLRENNPATTNEARVKISENNPMKNKEYIDKIGQTKLERYGDSGYNNQEKLKDTFIKRYGVDNPSKVKEILEKRINTYTTKLSNGEYTIKNNWKTGFYTNNNGLEEWYDSSYELVKMVEYNERNINWTKKHGIKIPFIKENGVNSFYVPDFLLLVESDKIIVEVKGWIKKDDIIKANKAIEWCKENKFEYYFLLGKELKIVNNLSYGDKNSKII
jgi:hypothetical protein